MVTPPSTPPNYSVKIADFGLARETHSKLPYTTYVSTRWYRAPEVLLRAGEYSAPVDMWAIGAMAVEIATLKPLFPGGNEVDQVWRVCEIMGSPGNWYNKSGARVGGGDWREGTRLAQKLGFSFPKMAPHAMETILQPPHWPLAFSSFVTWCLMWDPKNRPTSRQALDHEYFADAVDPLRPKSSSRLLGRKHSDLSFKSKDSLDSVNGASKPSWFRRSLIARESAPAVPQHNPNARPVHEELKIEPVTTITKSRPQATKRATWTNGTVPAVGAPMPILPSIRPISPLSNTVTVQGTSRIAQPEQPKQEVAPPTEEKTKKLGRQLSINSHGNHYADVHRQDAERALNGGSGLVSPPYGQKESFFSHLRKRARRFSGRHGLASPGGEDVEANAGTALWSNRSSMIVDSIIPENGGNDFTELDRALQSVRYSLEQQERPAQPNRHTMYSEPSSAQSMQKMTNTIPNAQSSTGNTPSTITPISSRTRRALQMTSHPVHHYETPEEEDELLDEALNSATRAVKSLDHTLNVDEQQQRTILAQKTQNRPTVNIPTHYVSQDAYPTPSPSAKRNGVFFGQEAATPAQPLNISKQRKDNQQDASHWPTPPYEENGWANSVFAASNSTTYH